MVAYTSVWQDKKDETLQEQRLIELLQDKSVSASSEYCSNPLALPQ